MAPWLSLLIYIGQRTEAGAYIIRQRMLYAPASDGIFSLHGMPEIRVECGGAIGFVYFPSRVDETCFCFELSRVRTGCFSMTFETDWPRNDCRYSS